MGKSLEECCEILEVSLKATPEEIRNAYKKLALKWHPDKCGGSSEATKKFNEISEAYKTLVDGGAPEECEYEYVNEHEFYPHNVFRWMFEESFVPFRTGSRIWQNNSFSRLFHGPRNRSSIIEEEFFIFPGEISDYIGTMFFGGGIGKMRKTARNAKTENNIFRNGKKVNERKFGSKHPRSRYSRSD